MPAWAGKPTGVNTLLRASVLYCVHLLFRVGLEALNKAIEPKHTCGLSMQKFTHKLRKCKGLFLSIKALSLYQ